MTLYNIEAYNQKYDRWVDLQFSSLKAAQYANPKLKNFRLVGVVSPDKEF